MLSFAEDTGRLFKILLVKIDKLQYISNIDVLKNVTFSKAAPLVHLMSVLEKTWILTILCLIISS